MATYLVKPGVAAGGSGALGNEFDTWANAAGSINPGDTILGCESLTATETFTVPLKTYTAALPLTIGTYEAQTGRQIKDNTRHHKFRPTSTAHGISFGTRAYITADNIDAKGIGATQSGITAQVASATTDQYATIRRCILDSTVYDAVHITGKGSTIEDCVIRGYTDGVIATCSNFTFQRNTTQTLSIDPTTYDALTLQGTHDHGFVLIVDNTFTDTVGTQKQGVYFASAGQSASTFALVARNTFSGFQQQILCRMPSAEIAQNVLSYSSLWGITIDANSVLVHDNLISNMVRAILVAGTYTGVVIERTTAADVDEAWVLNTGSPAVTLRNTCAVRRTGSSLPISTKITTATLTASYNRYYARSGAGLFLRDGTTHQTWDAYQAAANETASGYGDPLLSSSSYRPSSASTLFGAGIDTGAALDVAGVLRRRPPTIGAYEAT